MKIDVGIVALEPSKAELDSLSSTLKGEFGFKMPNMIYHIYKNRRGRHNKVKVWSYVDLGTCRSEDLFMTDNANQLIPIEAIDIRTFLDEDEEDIDEETGEIQ